MVTYEYDGDGKRVKHVQNGVTTVFLYDGSGRLAAEYSTQTPPAVGTRYVTTDHLGSTRIVTSATGSVVSRHDDLPYGDEIAATFGGRSSIAGYGVITNIRQRFTGKERNQESGLDFFGARYFSGAQGRFTSADTSIFGVTLTDPQSWNLYSYVRNRPLGFVDKSGKWATALHSDITTAALQGYLSPGQMREINKRHSVMDRDSFWGRSPDYEHAMASEGQDPNKAEALMWGFVALNLRHASQSLSHPQSLQAFGNLVHTLQDYTSPSHTDDSGALYNWTSYFSASALSHGFGENSPVDGWFRIGQAIRLTMAAFMQVDPEGARLHGLTSETFESAWHRRVTDYVNSYYKSLPRSAGAVAADAARQCALGNSAACD